MKNIHFIIGNRDYGKIYRLNEEYYILVKNKEWFKFYDKKFTLSKAIKKLDKLKKKFPNKEFKIKIIHKSIFDGYTTKFSDMFK